MCARIAVGQGSAEVPTAVPALALFLAEWRRVTPRPHC
jgi:hypothetical protein